jgi:adenosylhomocysteine nucleosidase
MTAVVLLVVALAAERHALQASLQARRPRRLGDRPAVRGRLAGRDILLVQAGIGRDRACDAVTAAAREFAVDAAWSLGFAGGLTERLRPGDLVFPAVVLDDAESGRGPLTADSSHATVYAALRRAAIPVDAGHVITVGTVLRTPEAKRAVCQRSGAVAAEMEAAGVARAARDLGIPWAALKAVVDAVDDPVPPFLAACTTPQGDLRWRGLLAGALEGRDFYRTLLRLGRASGQAGRTLWQGLDVAFEAWAALTGS